MKNKRIDMVNGPLVSGIVRFTVPIILSNALTILFNAADLVVVGNFCGSNAVAAVGATTTLVALIVNFFIGLSNGCGVVVAQLLGAKDNEKASRAVHTAIPTAFIAGALLTVVGLLFAKNFLQMMGTPKEIINSSALYLRIYFGGIILRMILVFSAAILRASGDTKSPLKYLALGGILNVLFNIFFVTVLKMDVDGVAYGTIISEGISGGLCLLKLIRRDDEIKFSFKKICFDIKIVRRIFSIGVPAGIQSSLFAISNVLIQSSVNSFGPVVVAGNSAASSISNIVATGANAFQQTSSNYMGQNIGARNYERAKKLPLTITLCMIVSAFSLGLLAVIFSKPLLGFYITDSPEAISVGTTRLYIVTLLYFTCGAMEVMTGILRGMGKSFVPMVITLLGACGLRILWIYTVFGIPQFHTIQSIYVSYPISWVITAAAQWVAFYFVWKQMITRHKLKSMRKREEL